MAGNTPPGVTTNRRPLPAKRTDAADLARLGASELAGAVRSKRVSSREAVVAHLRRTEAVKPAVNAVNVVLGEEALLEEELADDAVTRGADLARLHGVPFTVKENIDLVGPDDARRRAGGEAAVLATGMSPLGLGNDGFGSLRWSAQCCGVASLRSTVGGIPHATTVEVIDMPISGQLLEVEGPLARRVADLQTAYEVLAGPTWRDPWSVPASLRGPGLRAPISVALVVDPAGQGLDARIRDGMLQAAGVLVDAGHVVDGVEPPAIDLAAKTTLEMLAVDLIVAVDLLAMHRPGMQEDSP